MATQLLASDEEIKEFAGKLDLDRDTDESLSVSKPLFLIVAEGKPTLVTGADSADNAKETFKVSSQNVVIEAMYDEKGTKLEVGSGIETVDRQEKKAGQQKDAKTADPAGDQDFMDRFTQNQAEEKAFAASRTKESALSGMSISEMLNI